MIAPYDPATLERLAESPSATVRGLAREVARLSGALLRARAGGEAPGLTGEYDAVAALPDPAR